MFEGMDTAMARYFVLTMIALKQQKGEDSNVVKEYVSRLVTALETEVAICSSISVL